MSFTSNHVVSNQSHFRQLAQYVGKIFAGHKAGPGSNQRTSIQGSLVLDSFAETAIRGVRSARPAARQLVYQAENYDVCLSIESLRSSEVVRQFRRQLHGPHMADQDASDRLVSIMGQWMVMENDLSKGGQADVELVKDGRVTHATRSDEVGMFIFDGIPQGVYDLRIRPALKAEELNITDLKTVSGYC